MATDTAPAHDTDPPRFPMPRTCPYAPPADYARLRAQGPLARVQLPNGRPSWIVLRHAEAQALLTDRRISTDSSQPSFPTLSPDTAARDVPRAESDRLHAGFFIDMDPPEHDTYRRMLISEFSLRRIGAMRPAIQAIVDDALDAMLAAGPGADLVADFGLSVPSLVICQLLGVPYADRELFQSRTRQLVTSAGDPAAADEAIAAIRGYLDELVTGIERAPGDNLLGRLVTGHRAAGRLSHDALVGMAFLLLIAGHETTANMIPLGALRLLEDPSSLAALRTEPAGWTGAVDELLRYLTVVDWAAGDRMAIDDIDIGGVTIRAGDAVYIANGAGNRDERAFAEPDEFDIGRGARHHLAFGFGVHQCLGQNLARAEMEIAWRTLFERIPTLRLAVAADKLPFRYDAAIFGLYSMPVTW